MYYSNDNEKKRVESIMERLQDDMEMEVNLESFKFWLLQYSGCVKLLDRGTASDGECDDRNRNFIFEHIRSCSIEN